MSRTSRRTAYRALVRSVLEYGSIVWDPYWQTRKSSVPNGKIYIRTLRYTGTRMLKDQGLPSFQDRSFERAGGNESDVNMKPSSRIKWDKVNKERYIRLLDESLRSLDINVATVSTLDNAVIKSNYIISKCAKKAAPKGVERLRRAKLRSWTPQVQEAVKAKKKEYYEWKCVGRPDDRTNSTVINKKHTTKLLRQVCRIEHSNDSINQRQAILDTKTQEMALFHRLINKQRGKLKGWWVRKPPRGPNNCMFWAMIEAEGE